MLKVRVYLYILQVYIFFRWSKGCKRPQSFQLPYLRSVLLLVPAKKTYENSFMVLDEEGKCLNRVKHEFYNLRS